MQHDPAPQSASAAHALTVGKLRDCDIYVEVSYPGQYVIQLALVESLSIKVNTPCAPPCAILINFIVDSSTHCLTETPVTEDNPKELALVVISGVTALYKFEKKHFLLLG